MCAPKDPLGKQIVHSACEDFNLRFLARVRVQYAAAGYFQGLWPQLPEPGFYQTGFPCLRATESHDFSGTIGSEDREEIVAAGDGAADPFRSHSLCGACARGASERGWANHR